MRSTEIVRLFFIILISSMSLTIICQFLLLFKKNYNVNFEGTHLTGYHFKDNGEASLEELLQLKIKNGDITAPLSRQLQQREDDAESKKDVVAEIGGDIDINARRDEKGNGTAKGQRNSSILLRENGEEIAKEFYAKFAEKLETVERVLAVSPTKSKTQRISTYAEAYKRYNISSKKGTILAKNKRGETKILVTFPNVVPTNASDLGPMIDFALDQDTYESKEQLPGYKRMKRPKRPSREKQTEEIKTPGILNSTVWKSYIDLHEYKYILNPTDKCLTDEGTFKRVSLLMIVASAPKNFERRNAIRKTWGMATRSTSMHLETVFLVGGVAERQVKDDLRRELVNYGDIVQEDFVDSYLNLTIKTVMGLKWASRYCRNAKFVMKTDDDMAVNTIKMLVYLRTSPSKNFVAGKAAFNFDIIRDVYNKFYVPYSVTNDDKYPPYCIGIGYVISMYVVHKLYVAALQTPLFPWEDVYVGLCLRRIGVIPTLIKGFMGGGFFDDSKGGALRIDHTLLNRLRSSYVIHDVTTRQLEMVWGQWAGLVQP